MPKTVRKTAAAKTLDGQMFIDASPTSTCPTLDSERSATRLNMVVSGWWSLITLVLRRPLRPAEKLAIYRLAKSLVASKSSRKS